MDNSFFKYNGINSLDKKLIVSNEMKIPSSGKDIEVYQVPGRDGDVLVSKNRQNSISYQIPIFLQDDKLFDDQVSNLDWLKNAEGFRTLELSWDKDFLYIAAFYERYDIEQVSKKLGKTMLTFNVKPFKFLKTGQEELILGTSITNPLSRQSKPRIMIKGTGNMTLKIGSKTLILKNIQDGIIIDSLYEIATNLDGTRPAWDKVASYPLPVIEPGANAVTRTGSITEITIIPRWEAIV